jgi:hypothetical protein
MKAIALKGKLKLQFDVFYTLDPSFGDFPTHSTTAQHNHFSTTMN